MTVASCEHRYQSLAAVPEKDFEVALAGPEKPSTSGEGGNRTHRRSSSSVLLFTQHCRK